MQKEKNKFLQGLKYNCKTIFNKERITNLQNKKSFRDTCPDFIFRKIGQRISLISRLAKSKLTQLHPQLQKSLKQGTNYKLAKKDKTSLKIESPGLK